MQAALVERPSMALEGMPLQSLPSDGVRQCIMLQFAGCQGMVR